MNIKSLLKLETRFVTSLAATFILFLGSPLNSLAQTQSLPDSLNLTIKLQSAYNPGFKMCMPVAVNDPLEFAWTRGLVQSSISMSVSKPEGGAYPIKFALKEGMLNYARDVKLEPKLELEKPYESITQMSGGFEISYKQTLLLSKEDCK